MVQRFLRAVLIFMIVYLGLSLLLPNPNKQDELSGNDIGIKLVDDTVAQGNLVRVVVQNNMDTPLVLSETQLPPEKLLFERRENGRWISITPQEPKTISQPVSLPPHTKDTFEFSEFNREMFFTPGQYRVLVKPNENQQFEAEFEVFEPGFFRSLFRAIYKIIYNIFILLLTMGGHSLGLAIILITLLIKILLWTFNQHALESQRKMQKIQPELTRIREKYKNDQQKMAAETMAVWKKHKINPFASIAPLFVQFPVLIALFYVIRDGLLPHNTFLLYPPLQDFDFSQIQTLFLGIFHLDMRPIDDVSLLWLPVVVAGFQYWAMKLSFDRAAKKKEGKEDTKKEAKESNAMPSMQDQMEMMGKMMKYFLPVMIFFFTLTFPAGVGLYWWVSTLVGIGQQWLVNKKISN